MLLKRISTGNGRTIKMRNILMNSYKDYKLIEISKFLSVRVDRIMVN